MDLRVALFYLCMSRQDLPDKIAFITLTMGLAVEARYLVMPEMHGCVECAMTENLTYESNGRMLFTMRM